MKYALMGLLLYGCATHYGVQQLGTDRYEVSALAAPAAGGAGGARTLALEEANKHCAAQSKHVDVTDTTNRYAFPANSVATVTFRCR